jgi:hypothetical protein
MSRIADTPWVVARRNANIIGMPATPLLVARRHVDHGRMQCTLCTPAR